MCAPWSYRPRFANTDSVISARTAFGSRNLWADIFWCSNQELTGGEARFQLKLENGLFGAGVMIMAALLTGRSDYDFRTYRPPAPVPRGERLGLVPLILELKRNPLPCWAREHF